MKHIQSYENIEYSDYKKFAIWKNHNDTLLIIKTVLEEKDKLTIKTLYIYNKKTQQLEPTKVNNNIFYKIYVKPYIIYMSNKLIDCKNKINLITTSNKYNI